MVLIILLEKDVYSPKDISDLRDKYDDYCLTLSESYLLQCLSRRRRFCLSLSYVVTSG